MRTIRTFVLRLLTSSDDPKALRGMLQAVASGEEQPFKDEAALLVLLRQMQGKPTEVTPHKGKKNGQKEKKT